MTEGFAGIIAQLERQGAAIEKALAALREVEGGEAVPEPTPKKSVAQRSGKAGEAANRRSEGQKKRWALKKAAEAEPDTGSDTAVRRSRVTPEGRRKLAEAMKRRWVLKRAGSAVKKVGRKGRAPK